MLHIHVDPHSGVPTYRQMMDQIKYYVASGMLKPGDKVPSIRDLAKSLHVNPTTVVKAYSELAHEGVIELKQGRGAFVCAPATRIPSRQREEIMRRQAKQLAVEAAQLGVPGATVLKLVEEELMRLKGGGKNG